MSTNSTLRYVVISFLFLTLVIPFIVSGSLYFPYITGKGFLFRTLIELAAVVYIALIARDRSWLPRKSAVLWSLVAFLVIMAVATMTSQNPSKSFWSNYERMEGYVTLLHLGAYFVMMAGLFSRRTWTWFMHTSLFASVIVGLVALKDLHLATPLLRIQGTLGNSTYLGVYALIHIFLCIFLAVRVTERKPISESAWWNAGYAIFAIFNTYIMYHTGTRGSFVGFIFGVVLATVLIAIFERKNRVLKMTAVIGCSIVIAAILILGFSKNTTFVKSSPLLTRFGSLITLDVTSVLQTEGYSRTVLWSIAGNGFKDRPILGWGQESFNYVFAQHYDPRMYNQEQWFDRTHDVFFDWLIAGGLLGLLSYLSLFVAVIYMIWKRQEDGAEEVMSVTERSVLTGLLAAYFIHNIFVFDNLVSYLLFFMLLAYVAERTTPLRRGEKKTPLIADESGQWIAITAGAVVIIFALYIGVYKPYIEANVLIKALQANGGYVNEKQVKDASKDVKALEYFKDAFAQHSFGDSEARERLGDVAGNVITTQGSDPAAVSGFSKLMSEQYAIQIAQTPSDPRPILFYGIYLMRIGQVDEAITYLKRALALSPLKQSFDIQLAVAYFGKKDYADALPLVKSAYESAPENKEALTVYATILIYAGKVSIADQVLVEASRRGMAVQEDPRIIQALIDTKDYARVYALAKAELAARPNDPQVHVSIAALYLKIGDKAGAIRELRAAIALEPRFKAQGEAYIKTIEAGGDPTK